MKPNASIRLGLSVALAALLSAAPAFARLRGPQPGAKGNHPPVRAGERPPTERQTARPQANQDHLQQWMDRHRNLPLQDQLHQLENEPGFKLYPPQTQQRMRDQIVRLNNMTPQERERTFQRTEILEHMSVPQRQQYRAAAQNFTAMPPERQRLLARAVVDLRAMPPDQRQAVINSDRFRAQFSDGERSTLSSLLSVEPYAPPTPEAGFPPR